MLGKQLGLPCPTPYILMGEHGGQYGEPIYLFGAGAGKHPVLAFSTTNHDGLIAWLRKAKLLHTAMAFDEWTANSRSNQQVLVDPLTGPILIDGSCALSPSVAPPDLVENSLLEVGLAALSQFERYRARDMLRRHSQRIHEAALHGISYPPVPAPDGHEADWADLLQFLDERRAFLDGLFAKKLDLPDGYLSWS